MAKRLNLTNVKVATVKKDVSSGEGKYGPWTLWIITLDDPDWKDTEISWFKGEDAKVLPEEGKTYDLLELEEGTKGYLLKKIVAGESEKPKPNPNVAGKGGEKSGSSSSGYRGPDIKAMMYAYGKDLVVALSDKIEWSSAEAALHMTIFFGESLFAAHSGNEKILGRVRKFVEQQRGGGDPDQNPPKSETSTDTPDDSRDDPETDEKPKTKMTKEAAMQMAIDLGEDMQKIENIPHLQNKWNKICRSEERKEMEASFPEAWETLTNIYQEQQKRVKAEYRGKEKEDEGAEETSNSDGDNAEFPF